jgi:hypothetical protein
MDFRQYDRLAQLLYPLSLRQSGWPICKEMQIFRTYLVTLAAVSTLPILFNLVAPDKGDAVLLPFIDSANHLEGVSSSIQFNPLQREFNLLADRDCFVHEGDKTQFYISYGSKTDKELLLNYGFLPGLTSFDLEGGSDDVIRRKLAQMYVEKAVY